MSNTCGDLSRLKSALIGSGAQGQDAKRLHEAWEVVEQAFRDVAGTMTVLELVLAQAELFGLQSLEANKTLEVIQRSGFATEGDYTQAILAEFQRFCKSMFSALANQILRQVEAGDLSHGKTQVTLARDLFMNAGIRFSEEVSSQGVSREDLQDRKTA